MGLSSNWNYLAGHICNISSSNKYEQILEVGHFIWAKTIDFFLVQVQVEIDCRKLLNEKDL